MSRLSPVLTASELPLAELYAARLDGELVRLGECFTPIDQPHDRYTRAASIARELPDRLIAERLSAAWIWGALPYPPARHELCASLGARARASNPRRVSVREVAISPDEIVVIAGQRLTSPVRTLVDLARFSTEIDAEVLRALARVGAVTLGDCRAALDRRRNLPNKRRGWQRILESFGEQVSSSRS